MAGSKNDTQHSAGYNLRPSTAAETTLLQLEPTAVQFLNVSGSPEGVVPANVGSIANDRTNGVMYIKDTGTGNTGWQEIPSGGGVATTYDGDSGSATPALNILEILGDTSVAGTSPVSTLASGNTVTTFVQRSQALAASDASKIGLCNFDSSAFSVDANGFVTSVGGGTPSVKFGVDGATAPGTNPVLANGSGQVNFTGQIVAAGTSPLIAASVAANTVVYQAQLTQAIAASDTSKVGLCNFDSASFSVSNGFVTFTGSTGGTTWNDVSGAFSPLKSNGYFVTATATGTLPASPSQGDTIEFFVDTTQFLTIQASGSQIIRFGSAVTAAGGTAVSTARGDSVKLVYRTSGTCWCLVSGAQGVWTLT